MATAQTRRPNRSGAATRAALVSAARETLVQDGFARTSARSVAARAGCSQASLFYHFEGVPELLLAVLDEVSDRRMAAYREPLLAARTPRQLARLGRTIAADDIASGDLRVLVELVAGAPTVPGLKAQVARRIGRWEDLVARAAQRFIPPPLRGTVRPAVLAHAVVAGFLGLELLRDLREDGAGTEDVLTDLAHVGRLAAGAPDAGGPS
ncbi:TetR/AcrR family transcriptional regulator [Ornithinimicrobium avium]|uniref:TetR/AcrR family transcriptional regulator n=1 Tax=Ornithinimicrobium avium TaxID=2283195 RepID=UPI0013B37EFA|nr:TetR/AcrR family transcriptional regulator [Ornithinimicrobium avium]